MPTLGVIVPAHDEAGHIGPCLKSLLDSDPLPQGWRGDVVVVANGCRDDTATRARGLTGALATGGWALTVIDERAGGKLNALNRGEALARAEIRAYLDADVRVDPALMAQLVRALDTEQPRYASGRPRITPAHNRTTRAYGRFWSNLPFMAGVGVPGFGLFAVNAAGRARWGAFPDIISDDTFVRLQFAPHERIEVAAGYSWPLVEGFANLVRVRRRQDAGVKEIATRYPALAANGDTPRLSAGGLMARALRDPVGFASYAAVAVAVRTPLFRGRSRWVRGR